jgi:bifunctional oligoribonuclease and PAP phosphatase NrnA
MKNLAMISKALVDAGRIAILSHEDPDGDAIGSSLGAYFGLLGLKKDLTVLNPDPLPSHLAFLPGSEKIETAISHRPFDLYLVLDCGDRSRVGTLLASPRGPIVNIDHHESNGRFGDLNWVEERASSTGELMYRLLFERMGLPLSEAAATNLYTAILTDTGSFRFSNTSPRALRIAASLLKMSQPPDFIASQLYEDKNLGQLRVLGAVLSSIEVEEEGKIAWGLITQEMLSRGPIALEETEGFVNFPRSIRGVEVAAVFKEVGFREYRLSLRSKGAVDVGKVAAAFHGGGHHNASGCSLSGGFPEVKEQVLEEIRHCMRG